MEQKKFGKEFVPLTKRVDHLVHRANLQWAIFIYMQEYKYNTRYNTSYNTRFSNVYINLHCKDIMAILRYAHDNCIIF